MNLAAFRRALIARITANALDECRRSCRRRQVDTSAEMLVGQSGSAAPELAERPVPNESSYPLTAPKGN
jgi:hypothetical protein